MNTLSRIFGAVQPRFLARAYLIGGMFFALMVFMQVQADIDIVKSIPMLAVFAISTLLFPFAKFIWNEIRDFVMGDTVIFANVIILFFLKFIINAMIWCFAIFIAPIGMAYLWYRTRGVSSELA